MHKDGKMCEKRTAHCNYQMTFIWERNKQSLKVMQYEKLLADSNTLTTGLKSVMPL